MLRFDVEPFSSGRANAPGQSWALDALALGFLHGFFNRRHRSSGQLFQGRYKSFLVQEGEYWTLSLTLNG